MRYSSRSLAFAILLLGVYSFTFGALKACSSGATVPINIKVNGKLIISDEVSEGSMSDGNTVVAAINTDRSRNGFNLLNEYKLRIRSNETKWRLVGNIIEIPMGKKKRISPNKIKLTYELSNGSKANPHSARLVAPFTAPVSLNNVPKKSDFIILEGSSKTSLERDPGNHDNWLGLTFKAEYIGKESPLKVRKIVYRNKKYNAIVSYTLVSL